MTTTLRGRLPLVLIAAFASLLAAVAPASGATVIRTSTAVRGLAWASTVDAYGAAVAPFVVTADRGLSWAPAQTGEVAGPDQVRWAIAPGGALLESSDSGATWHEITALTALMHSWFPPFGFVGVADIVVDPDRSGVVYAVIVAAEGNSEMDTVAESVDDGATWTVWTRPLFVSTSNDLAVWRAIPGRDAFVVADTGTGAGIQTIRIVTPTSDRTVLRQRPTTTHIWTGGFEVDRSGSRVLLETNVGWKLSTDGGAHLHALGLAQAESPVFDPSGAGRIYALRGGTLYHSADAGRHWQRRGRATGATVLAVDRGGVLVYASGPAGNKISRDAGRTFQPVAV